MKKLKQIYLLLLIIVVFCSGCDVWEKVDKGLDSVVSIVEEEPNDDTKFMCEESLKKFIYGLNQKYGPTALIATEWNSGLTDLRDALSDVPNSEAITSEKNILLINEITSRVFDDNLNINYDTISNLDFAVREMYDVGEYIRANCVMKNNDQLYNVTVQWHFVDNIAGINCPLVSKITINQ